MDRSRCFVRRLLLAVTLAVAVSACQVRTAVTVDVGDDGSGTVEVATSLDRAAVRQLPDIDGNGTSDADDLAALIRADDLKAAGWTVGRPATAKDGTTSVRVVHRFGTPEEANEILAQLTGPNGALRNLHVSRRDPFGRTQFGFSGVADLSKGLDSFGDSGLAKALDGKPLGEDQPAIEKRTGQKLADSFHLHITAKLPGDTRTWSPRLGDPPLRMESDGTVYHWGPLILFFVAAGCVIAFALVMVRRALKAATGS